MHQDLLSVENLHISFINERSLKAVDSVSFDLGQEEVLGLVGESGCGKTLTALSIMRLLPPNSVFSGKILYKGTDLLTRDENYLMNVRGRDISMIFQEPMTSLNPVFTIGNQVSEVMIRHEKLSKKQAREKTVDLLRVVGIPSPELRIREYPHQMSGGMRQRVMIAMAIACNPSLIIADEPTTALDVTIQAQILELLDGLKVRNKMALLLITHDLGIIAEWARRVIIMYAGRIVEEANVQEIFTNPRHPYTRGLLESLPTNKGDQFRPIPGMVPALNDLPEGCKFSTRCRYVISECRVKEPGLDPVRTVKQGQGNSKHLSRCIRAMEI
jgi:peptide/nickel transport system ATP-binding protein/oligopeptide transport system ATP-binding protein